MNLDAIPAGTRVLVDANTLIYAVDQVSLESRRLLDRCGAGDLTGFLTVISLAEFCHRRLMQEAQSLGLAAANPAKALARDQSLVRKLARYAQETEDLLARDLHLLAWEDSDFHKALALQRQFGLLTNDSLHLAAGLRVGIEFVATSDSDFDSVPDITVCKPGDLP